MLPYILKKLKSDSQFSVIHYSLQISSNMRTSPYGIWDSINNGAIVFESLTDDTFEGALNVIRKSFFYHENVCKAVDLLSESGASKELEELCFDAAKDGVSVVAVDTNNRKVIGVAFNKIQLLKNSSEKSTFEIFRDNCKCKSSKALIDFMINIDSRIDLFKHYNTDCIFEIMFLATLPSNQKCRIGELLVTSSIKIVEELKKGNPVKTPVTINDSNIIENLEKIPNVISAIMTSNYSQKIATKCGFEHLFSISYDEFHFNNKVFSENIGDEHRNCILVAKKLS
ncbi:uncharacterized protein LOC122717104 [Apis laboriosa]|uniref:uncharacterized protein LOC122717104 n=1 Tax=Apis laboriosa TaxID=183418 RepID=UPI001CC71151|nr:uncharacterized protein LOC122717104 [Apis laboriosa]